MQVNEVVLGNVCSLGAMVADSISGRKKDPKEILTAQTISQVFWTAGSLILKGYSASVQNIIGILRNIASIRKINNRALEWTLILSGVVLGIAFNNRGLFGWLPIIANLEYSIAVFRFRDSEKNLKLCFLAGVILFMIYDFIILNYVGFVANIIVAISTLTSLKKGSGKSSQDL